MKKTLTALAAIAALGTGIITAQAETGFNAYESVGILGHMASDASAAADSNYEVHAGEKL